METQIYNFKHTLSQGSYSINGVELIITDEHIKNLSLLSDHGSLIRTLNHLLIPTIKKKKARKGRIVPTAILKYDNAIDSVYYPKQAKKTNIDDICLLLGFLTGRSIDYKDLSNISRIYFEQLVTSRIFYEGISIDLCKLEANGVVEAFWNTCLFNTCNEMGTRAFYSNACFNQIYERWCVKNNQTKYENGVSSKVNERVKKLLEDNIDAMLMEMNISDPDLIGKDALIDIIKGFKLREAPSAVLKVNSFLKGIGCIDGEITKEVDARIKLLNKVRNSFVHYGGLPNLKPIDKFEKVVQVSGACINITKYICDYYLGKFVLEIDDSKLNSNLNVIKKYFNDGELNGQKIFVEDYEQYLERITKDWLTNKVG